MIVKKYLTVENVTAQTWLQKVVNSEIPVVVNFSAVRCGFCRALEPLYNRLSEQYSGKLDFLNLMVDDPQNKEVLLHASVEGTPTLKFYCRAREVGEHVGYSIEPVLKQKIDSMLAEMESCLNNSTPLEKAGQAKH
ncbi:MAG TPA: thioredoxin family protein [Nitrososphaera sp.]|jgi:thioredoxin 1|nr:thioredoxin family protein [Nitrososphaera sp.]